jgi:hypothetical protein
VKTHEEGKMEGKDSLHMFPDFVVPMKCHQMSYTVIYNSFEKVKSFCTWHLQG